MGLRMTGSGTLQSFAARSLNGGLRQKLPFAQVLERRRQLARLATARQAGVRPRRRPIWIVLDEVNEFTWPGYDVRRVEVSKDYSACGLIPPRLNDAIIVRILELATGRRIDQLSRD